MKLPPAHPARKFLEAFAACQQECVAREITTPGAASVDQAWHSAVDGKPWRFSKFAYTFLALDVVLDGWITAAPQLTESETTVLQGLPYLRTLLSECEAAAQAEGNGAILPLIERTRRLLDLWEACIRSRPLASG